MCNAAVFMMNINLTNRKMYVIMLQTNRMEVSNGAGIRTYTS